MGVTGVSTSIPLEEMQTTRCEIAIYMNLIWGAADDHDLVSARIISLCSGYAALRSWREPLS
jgi:hypothetical protein